jgi:hypothetical protein
MMGSSFKKKILSTAMTVAMASGVLISGNASAIHVNDKGIGQVLMAPIYMGDFGYKTKVSIVNTRVDTAVKTRVALRSRVNSIEFDFVCYMTPSDVCQFEIVQDADGQAYLKSTDDSLLANSPSSAADYQPLFASQCAGLTDTTGTFCKDGALYVKVYDQQLPTNTGGVLTNPLPGTTFPRLIAAHAHSSNADDNELGHIEVVGGYGARGTIRFNDISDFEVSQSRGTAQPLQNRVTIKAGMSKADLYKVMGDMVPSVADGPSVPQFRQRLAGYDLPMQSETAFFAVGRMVNGVCQVNPITDPNGTTDNTTDALKGSGIISDANYGQPCDINGNIIPEAAPTNVAQIGSKIRSTDPRWVRLTGLVEMESVGTGDRMGMQMTALDGSIWDNLTPRDSATPYGLTSNDPTGVFNANTNPFAYAFDGRLISDPTFDVNAIRTLSLGDGFARVRAGLGDTTILYDNIIEIERALAANSLKFTYESDAKNSTNLIVTFPTKYRHLSNAGYVAKDGKACENDRSDANPSGSGICIDATVPNDLGNVCGTTNTVTGNLLTGRYYYPPFRSEQSGSILRGLASYDNQEHTINSVATINPFSGLVGAAGSLVAITDEVNYMFIPSWAYPSGWANLTLTAEPGCAYDGVPVLAYAHKTQMAADGFHNSWLVPLSKNSAND